jgi:pilus assembly protein Flp/PilA
MINQINKLHAKLVTEVHGLMNDERGLTAVEYAVLGAFVVAAVAAVGATFKTNLGTAFTSLFSKVPAA